MMSPSAPTLLVVAAIILRDHKVLLTQRSPNTHLPLHWEFPGGKVEGGESPAEALRRELREEIGVESEIGEPFAFNWHDYGSKRVLLLTYLASIRGDGPRAIGVRDLGWFARDEISGLTMPPADAPILERLLPLLR